VAIGEQGDEQAFYQMFLADDLVVEPVAQALELFEGLHGGCFSPVMAFVGSRLGGERWVDRPCWWQFPDFSTAWGDFID